MIKAWNNHVQLSRALSIFAFAFSVIKKNVSLAVVTAAKSIYRALMVWA